MRSYLGKTLAAEIAAADTTQRELARRCKMQQATISMVISGQRNRPDITTLRKLCRPATWGARGPAIRILCAHLQDEIHHAGHPPGTIDIRPADITDGINGTADRLREIRAAAPDAWAHIESLIALIHATATAPTEHLKAAETPEKYGENTPQKKLKKGVDATRGLC
jgi:transcriptional regulator with XRE-family HTH domain